VIRDVKRSKQHNSVAIYVLFDLECSVIEFVKELWFCERNVEKGGGFRQVKTEKELILHGRDVF
jgi:hypothetical protein